MLNNIKTLQSIILLIKNESIFPHLVYKHTRPRLVCFYLFIYLFFRNIPTPLALCLNPQLLRFTFSQLRRLCVCVRKYFCVSRQGAVNVWEAVGAASCVLLRSLCLVFLKPYITLDGYVTAALIPVQKKWGEGGEE